MPSDRVPIVGAGVAGLSLAITLRQRGISATVVVRGEPGPATGIGLYLVGAATRALSALGVAEAAVRAGAVSRSQAFDTHRGRRLAVIDAESFWAPCGPCIGVARAALHHLRWNGPLAPRSATTHRCLRSNKIPRGCRSSVPTDHVSGTRSWSAQMEFNRSCGGRFSVAPNHTSAAR